MSKRKYNKLSDEDRLHFIEDALSDGVASACLKHNVPSSTGHSLVKRWESSKRGYPFKRLRPGPKPGTPRKMTKEIKEYLEKRILKDNTLSSRQLVGEVKDKFDLNISKSSVSAHLASNNWSYRSLTQEDVAHNTEELINERHRFAQRMLQDGLRPEDPSSIIYWDITHLEPCIVARKVRHKARTPTVAEKSHKVKRKNNSLTLCVAMSGTEVLLVRSQFAHFTSEDYTIFFKELLEKIDKESPTKKFTFIGDNEGIYKDATQLLLLPKYRRHTLVPNPPHSPFLNGVEYLFKQLKSHVGGKQYKILGHLLRAVQESFENIQPEHISSYHKTVYYYLLECLQRKPIHTWRVKLGKDESQVDNPLKQKWDVKHWAIFEPQKMSSNKVNATVEMPKRTELRTIELT